MSSTLASSAVSFVNKMDMSSSSSSSSSSTCKISMLWNWYTINSCFIAKSWHVRTKAQFAGSCIGCFFLVMSAQWLHRFSREYDAAIARRKQVMLSKTGVTGGQTKKVASDSGDSSLDIDSWENDKRASLMFLPSDSPISNLFQPIIYVFSHDWFLNFSSLSNASMSYPNFIEHTIRALIFAVQWTQSYIIMLLFMYYNGYIIISCILGAFFGRLVFNYEPITCVTRSESEVNDRKCCM
ncbi:hypothetical protein WICPIJ_000878 [Wickerhamomyces pijperi]|uniref:Copper transport protein n=1 Tax=Wickerhamomyces pijperi TaxID=599730 RepID=A0A9P8QEV2_WICPI|nr:hypothetical protein WICPIJ_000878 [Wickerhamomyces pijperi]